jgi:hypothetical protein
MGSFLMNRQQQTANIARQLVDHFLASGCEFTCRAVFDQAVTNLANDLTTGTKISARRVVNLAADMFRSEHMA